MNQRQVMIQSRILKFSFLWAKPIHVRISFTLKPWYEGLNLSYNRREFIDIHLSVSLQALLCSLESIFTHICMYNSTQCNVPASPFPILHCTHAIYLICAFCIQHTHTLRKIRNCGITDFLIITLGPRISLVFLETLFRYDFKCSCLKYFLISNLSNMLY